MGTFKTLLDANYNSIVSFLSVVAGRAVAYKKDYCYCIVEGKTDKDFYANYFEKFYNKIKLIPVAKVDEKANKALVKEYLDIFNRKQLGPKKQFLFFMDNDFGKYINDPNIPQMYGAKQFDDTTNPENLYVTDEYSIENSIFTKGTIINLFKNFKKVLHNKKVTIDFKNKVILEISEHYDKQLKKYEQKLVKIIALLIYCKLNKIEYTLDDVTFNIFFEIEANGMLYFKYETNNGFISETNSNYDEIQMQSALKRFVLEKAKIHSKNIDDIAIEKIENDIKTDKIYHLFRGHFLDSFWISFGQKFKQFTTTDGNKIPIPKTEYDLHDTYVHCAYIESLTNFADRTICKFKKEIKSID